MAQRLFTDGQLMEGQCVEITKFEIYKFSTLKGGNVTFSRLTLSKTKECDVLTSIIQMLPTLKNDLRSISVKCLLTFWKKDEKSIGP